MNLSIGEIARACKGRLVLCKQNATGVTEDTLVDSVVINSKNVKEGGVFVATVGARVDGHSFIPQTFAAGAVLAVTEKTPEQVEAECGVPAADWGNYLCVEDSFQALKDMAEYYRSKLSIPVVGITGSVGKTSTKEFIAGVLAEKYRVLKTEGNFNNEVGVPLTLLRIREEHEAAVIEMGISDFGEMRRLSKMVCPNVCVITNIGQCHLENLKSREGILRAKTEIFDYMAPDGEVCLNGDDDMLRTVTEVRGRRTHFFGLENSEFEEVYASDIRGKGLWGSEALLHLQGETADLPIEVSLPGRHMVVNATAAACVAKILGLTAWQIAEGIRKVRPVGGRNNLLRLKDYTVIDDCYNANPVSMRAALDLLAMADTRRVAILGDMFELGEDSDAMHAGVGAYAVQKGTDHIICVGANSRHMYERAVETAQDRGEETSNPEETSKSKIYYFADREGLMKVLAERREELLPKGCTVLVKASHGMNFAEVVEYLSR
ncbi:MAG: UDP-N-acetylmuramoyl-tripeptide--D-alanyl-D-alanine ligase [Clostridium sp.]|nr:UDP-N-acetylmuramoyl-tripeptide--D-alanyl-D-alanine ligase [Acetatifactor muris]MCM1528209.1 UDP-N-acetylmuramoyl-tripeptide--D-alanyl-D-alanine ligase [Bacteroides sp.]MCM1564304.1 UDP-N-acetylmuramoyl-tripeptide--D-alanyl-D-alanine ligase [Clostridium sp.]